MFRISARKYERPRLHPIWIRRRPASSTTPSTAVPSSPHRRLPPLCRALFLAPPESSARGSPTPRPRPACSGPAPPTATGCSARSSPPRATTGRWRTRGRRGSVRISARRIRHAAPLPSQVALDLAMLEVAAVVAMEGSPPAFGVPCPRDRRD
ncbi:hypothetical protein VPH35_001979 [Triticum aestivum]